MKTLLSILLLSFGLVTKNHAQENEITSSKWAFALSFSPDSYRYPQADQSKLYYQLSIDRHLTNYLVAGIYIGHQYRKSSFTSEYPIEPYTVKTIDYERTYTPLGFRFGFDLSSYFSQQLGWIKDKSKWGILVLGYGGLTIRHLNILTPIETGEAVEWSDFELDEDMNYITGINAVIKYFPTKQWGIYGEAGIGPVGRYSLGVAYRLF